CATQSTALPGAASLCPVPLHGLRPLATSFGHLLPACGGVVLVATTTSALARGPLVKCAGAERPPACDSCLARVALADAALPSFVSLAALEVDGGRYRPTPTLGALGSVQRVTPGAPAYGGKRYASALRSGPHRGEIGATRPPANGVGHRCPAADADTGTGVLTVDVEDGHISTPACARNFSQPPISNNLLSADQDLGNSGSVSKHEIPSRWTQTRNVSVGTASRTRPVLAMSVSSAT